MPQQNVFLGLPDIMNGIRLCPANSFWTLVDASGNTYNFKDLGLQVIGYTGAGMAPVINQTTPYALIGGSYYQRTVPGPRTLTLLCYIDADNLRGLQLLRKALESYIAPDTSTQQAAQIKLRYALTNYCGDVIGTVSEMACNYVSGLEGNVDNLNQERFALQFIEYAPPSIKELASNSNSLTFQNAALHNAVTTTALRSATGAWSSAAAFGSNIAHFSAQDDYYFDNAANIYKNGVAIQAINNPVRCYTTAPNGLIIIGGDFTTPQNYIMSTNGTIFSALGATINNSVTGVVYGPDGNLYACGAFGAPAPGHFARWNGAAWAARSDPGVGMTGVARGLDGFLYGCGGAILTGFVGRYDITADVWNPMGTGANNNVNTIVVGSDGKVYIGGTFTAAGGVACSKVAVWNGVTWQPLGPGLNGSVTKLFFDTVGNALYAAGAFTGVGNNAYFLPGSVAKWNGSVWLPVDVNGTSTANYIVISQTSRRVLTYIGNFADASALNTITNTGSANAVPTFVFTGPGQLIAIINNTTGKALYFNYLLLTGENAILTVDPVALSFVSSFSGNAINKILPGSDLATFNIKPGTDNISVLISGTTSGATGATLLYRNTHWHFDAGVA